MDYEERNRVVYWIRTSALALLAIVMGFHFIAAFLTGAFLALSLAFGFGAAFVLEIISCMNRPVKKVEKNQEPAHGSERTLIDWIRLAAIAGVGIAAVFHCMLAWFIESIIALSIGLGFIAIFILESLILIEKPKAEAGCCGEKDV